MSATYSKIEIPSDPIGGKPPAGSVPSVDDLDYQVKYQGQAESGNVDGQ